MGLDLVQASKERQAFQLEDERRYRLLPNTAHEIVFAGDSLVADGEWSEFYSDVHNRGIGGDRTDNVLDRLDEILESHPQKLVFLMGSNDLSAGVPVVQILRNYRAILNQVVQQSPDTRIFVSALWPVNPSFTVPPFYSNQDVQAVNQPLRQLVGEFPNARFFDLHDLLADDQGELKRAYTGDGLHLNLQGYLAIQEKIQAILNQP